MPVLFFIETYTAKGVGDGPKDGTFPTKTGFFAGDLPNIGTSPTPGRVLISRIRAIIG